MKDHAVSSIIAPVPLRALTVGLAHNATVHRMRSDFQDFCQALVHEHILTVHSKVLLGDASLRSGAIPARIVVFLEVTQSLSAEDLDWAVQAVLAIAHVGVLLVVTQDYAKPVRKKDGIGIHFYRPVVFQVRAIREDLLPDSDEDPRIQCSAAIATEATREGAVDRAGLVPRPQRDGLIAVDGPRITTEDAHVVLLLPYHQLPFLAGGVGQPLWRHDQGEAKQCGLALLRHHRDGGPRIQSLRRYSCHDPMLGGLLRQVAALQPALAFATLETGVLDPHPRSALLVALAQSTAHLRMGDVVHIVAIGAVRRIVGVAIHAGAIGRKVRVLLSQGA
mmetsp:Transcript_62718/g.134678  ORF Transcript_62718/g.134678 Transcript_62718/m.134678 type:complete len:334 (-) Transcript_62718:293-1294(-)